MTLVIAVFLVFAGSLGLLASWARVCSRRAATAWARCAATEERYAALTRHVRLAAHDLRGVGMAIHGHADYLAAERHRDAEGVASGAADLLDLADDLQDLTLEAAAPRVLREEDVSLGSAVDESIAAVSSTILPGRRNWRVQPDVRTVWLHGDRRALRHALSRVLADAVRNTQHDDWIDVGTERRGDVVAVWIADEGKGTLTPEIATANRDSRGIGTRLMLARILVEAHGGRLEVEAQTGVGSRVSLIFPAERIVPAIVVGISLPLHSYGGRAPVSGSAGQ